jgi:exodeoxyribonuclease VII small subunit
MSTKAKKIPKSTKFEDALGELEELVRELESGEQPLEESLARFERGVALSRYCQQSLAEAEQKVRVLINAGDESDEELANFEPEA